MKELENLKRSKKAIEEFIKNLANNDSIDFERLMDEMSTCPCLELSVVNNLFDGINDQMLENLNMNNNKYVVLGRCTAVLNIINNQIISKRTEQLKEWTSIGATIGILLMLITFGTIWWMKSPLSHYIWYNVLAMSITQLPLIFYIVKKITQQA